MSKKISEVMNDYTNGKGDKPRVRFDDKDKDRLDKIFKRGKYAKKNDGEKNDK